MTAPVSIGAIKRERVEGANRAANVFVFAIMALFFIIPFIIVALFHLFGWKVAVSAFPLLIIAVRTARLRQSKQRSKPSRPQYATILYWIAICAIPLISVAFSEPDIMRIWAIAGGVALTVEFMDKKSAASDADATSTETAPEAKLATYLWTALPAVLFVISSEIIWRFTTFAIWIWFHAFFMHVFIALWVSVLSLRNSYGQAQSGGDTVLEARPPVARSKVKGERCTVHVKRADCVWLKYDKITLGQACRLFECLNSQPTELGPEWANIGNGRKVWLHYSVDFDGHTTLVITNLATKNDGFFGVEWKHVLAAPGLWLKTPWKITKADHITASIVPELLEFGWREDWEKLAERLEPFTKLNGSAS